MCTLQELKVLRCRNCQLKKINPQLYNLLPLLSELDLGRNEVCVATPIHAPDIFQLFLVLAPFFFLQFKFLDKDEFRDVKRLTKVLLDGNQLSVVVDQLFRMQKSLNHLGELLKLPTVVSLFPFLKCSFTDLVDLLSPRRFILQPSGQSAKRFVSAADQSNISGLILQQVGASGAAICAQLEQPEGAQYQRKSADGFKGNARNIRGEFNEF